MKRRWTIKIKVIRNLLAAAESRRDDIAIDRYKKMLNKELEQTKHERTSI